MEDPKPNNQRIRPSRPFKLKDHPPNRSFMFVQLKEVFGFMPEKLIIKKLPGQNNWVQIYAYLTPEEVKKEDKMIEERRKKAEAIKKVEEAVKNSKPIKNEQPKSSDPKKE